MLAKLKLFVVVVLAQQVAGFQQHEYRLIHEKYVVEDYNKDYIEDLHVDLFKYNETSMAYNVSSTLKHDLEGDVWAYAKILQSEDGVNYRPYPVKFSLNLCEVQRKDTFGTRDIFLHSNFTDCPVKKGTYYLSNYSPDESKFPAYVPHGKLIVEMKAYRADLYLGTARWYGTVQSV